jgi:hypothetical protein
VSYRSQAVDERQEREKTRGTRIVIFGALASMLLWFTVLMIGDPIRSFGSVAMSNFYGIAISTPAAVVSIIALIKVGKRKKSREP